MRVAASASVRKRNRRTARTRRTLQRQFVKPRAGRLRSLEHDVTWGRHLTEAASHEGKAGVRFELGVPPRLLCRAGQRRREDTGGAGFGERLDAVRNEGTAVSRGRGAGAPSVLRHSTGGNPLSPTSAERDLTGQLLDPNNRPSAREGNGSAGRRNLEGRRCGTSRNGQWSVACGVPPAMGNNATTGHARLLPIAHCPLPSMAKLHGEECIAGYCPLLIAHCRPRRSITA